MNEQNRTKDLGIHGCVDMDCHLSHKYNPPCPCIYHGIKEDLEKTKFPVYEGPPLHGPNSFTIVLGKEKIYVESQFATLEELLKDQRKQSCQDMIKYMENYIAPPHLHVNLPSFMLAINVAKEYLKTL